MKKNNIDFDSWLSSKSICVCIPCLNEGPTIKQVVQDFQKSIPQAKIRVYDNNSTDSTAEEALAAGAVVSSVRSKGKGYVVRRIFEESTEDLIVMVDGDATYSASSIMKLLKAQYESSRAMIVGSREEHKSSKKAFRPLHVLGNRLITFLVRWSFNYPISDVLSGYRVFPKKLYKSLELNSQSFDIETELTLQVLALKTPIKEVVTPYYERPSGSHSKLNTWRDGFLIVSTIALLVRYYRPLFFFNLLSAFISVLGLIIGWAPISDYIQFRHVYHVPLALLAASLIIIAVILFAIGLILDSIRYFHLLQMKRINRDQQ